MSLEKREITTIAIGGAILLLSVGFVIVRKSGSSLGGPSAQSLEAVTARAAEYERLMRSVSDLKRTGKIDPPQGQPGEQQSLMLEDIGRLAKDHGLDYTTLKPATTGTQKAGAPNKPVQFRIELSGHWDNLVLFIRALEASPIPYVVREIHIDSATRAPREMTEEEVEEELGPPPPGNGSVRAAIKIQSYVFPASGLAAAK